MQGSISTSVNVSNLQSAPIILLNWLAVVFLSTAIGISTILGILNISSHKLKQFAFYSANYIEYITCGAYMQIL